MGFMEWLFGGKKMEKGEGRTFSSIDDVLVELQKKEQDFLEEASEIGQDKLRLLSDIRAAHAALGTRVRREKDKKFLNILVQNEKRIEGALLECEETGRDYPGLRREMARIEKARLQLQHATQKEAQMFWDFPEERRTFSQKIRELGLFQKRFSTFLAAHRDQKVFSQILSRRRELEAMEVEKVTITERKEDRMKERDKVAGTVELAFRKLQKEKEVWKEDRENHEAMRKILLVEEASLESPFGAIFAPRVKALRALLYDLGERELMEDVGRLEKGRYHEEDVVRLFSFLKGVQESPSPPRAFSQVSGLLSKEQDILDRFKLVRKHKEKAKEVERERASVTKDSENIRALEQILEEKQHSRDRIQQEISEAEKEIAAIEKREEERSNEVLRLVGELGWKIVADESGGD